jgi:streptogramin lyase
VHFATFVVIFLRSDAIGRMKMNIRRFFHSALQLLVVVSFVLTACQPQAVATSSVPTATAIPPTVLPTPAPTNLPTPTIAPADLSGRYMFGGDVESLVDMLADGSAYITEAPFMATHDAFTISGDQITFKGESCGNVGGTYHWSLQKDVLKFTLVSDFCSSRAKVLSQTLKKLPRQHSYATVVWTAAINQDYNQSAVDQAGNIYTTDGSGSFFKYDPNGKLINSWGAGLSYTTGIAVDPKGNIYVANFDPPEIHKFGPDGKPILSWKIDGGTVGPTGLAMDAQGNLYVALHRIHDHYVEKYNPADKLIASLVPHGSGDGEVLGMPRNGPESIAADALGNFYIDDPVNQRVIKFDPNGKFLFNITGDGKEKLSQGGQITLDAQGNVYISASRVIWKFDENGKFLDKWFTPYDGTLTIDAQGNMILFGQLLAKISLPAK